MSWVAAAVVGGAVIGGVATNMGAKKSADAQIAASNAANHTQMSQFNQTRADQAPWRQAGTQALDQINQFGQGDHNFSMSDFQSDPGYQFRLSEGQKAIERGAAARGSGNSGATMKALMGYGQNMASQEYSNAYDRYNNDKSQRFNRLASVAGIGQTANGQLASAGMNAANNISQNQIGVGNAQAASNMATANAINNGVGQGMNTWMQYQMMNKYAPTTPTGIPSYSQTPSYAGQPMGGYTSATFGNVGS